VVNSSWSVIFTLELWNPTQNEFPQFRCAVVTWSDFQSRSLILQLTKHAMVMMHKLEICKAINLLTGSDRDSAEQGTRQEKRPQ
jgi:hypothetical protein